MSQIFNSLTNLALFDENLCNRKMLYTQGPSMRIHPLWWRNDVIKYKPNKKIIKSL